MQKSKIVTILACVIALHTSQNGSHAAVTYTLSQTNPFSGLRTGTRDFSFDLIQKRYEGNSAITKDIEIGQIRDISFTAVIRKIDGSWTFDNPNSVPGSLTITQWIKGWFSSIGKNLGINLGSLSSPTAEWNYAPSTQTVDPLSSLTGNFGGGAPVSLTGNIFSADYGSFLGDKISDTAFAVSFAANSYWDAKTAPGMDVTSLRTPSISGELILSYTVIPEPSAASLLTIGIGGLIALRRTRRG